MVLFTALTNDNNLVLLDSDYLGEATIIPVTGIEGDLLGIDVRPSNGLIYGVTTSNNIYTLDPAGFGTGSFDGMFTLTDEEELFLFDDALYVNLHTAAFNGGELRGQIEVDVENDIVSMGIPIEEMQEVGDMTPPDGPAMGAFNVIYDDATNALSISGTFTDLTSNLLPVGDTDVEGNPQSSIHLHNGVAGAAGPIVRNFSVDDSGSFEGTFTLTDDEEALLLGDAFYVNLHTDNFNGGELRGQVNVDVEGDIVAPGIPIEETQEVGDMTPPDGTAAGMFDLIYDNATNGLAIAGTFDDLAGPLFPVGNPDAEGNPQSAVHIHNGLAGENGPIIRNLNTADNVATLISTLNIPFEADTVSGFDFNPVADRLRLVGDNEQNFRVNVETGEVILDGTLAFADGDMNAGNDPTITAAAYTNSVSAPTTTALYDIDSVLDTLLLQDPPNDGTLVTVGDLGIDFDAVGGFDIFSSMEGDNTAFAVSDETFYEIDLQTGMATNLGTVSLDSDVDFLGLTVREAPAAPATNFVVLNDVNTLLTFDSSSPDQVSMVEVTGVEGTLLGIDVRPSNGLIYGLSTANNLYTIDAITGEATLSSTLSVPFEAGVISGFDFNPVADRLRLVGDNDQNFRINVETGEVIVDGTLAFADGDVSAGTNPNITAAAYTNSVAAPTTTALYDIDPLLNTLLLQSPPNDGTLVTVGDLGVDFDVVGGFDIVSPMEGSNAAFAVSDGALYSVDLETGMATSMGMIGDGSGFNILGFTALPSSMMDDRPGVSNYAMEPTVVDFDGDGFMAGDSVMNQFEGVTISTSSEFGAMLFDTSTPTGGDTDLLTEDQGLVMILSEDGDASDPDDAAMGGTFSFDFDELVGVSSVGLLDIEEMGGTITFYDEDAAIIEMMDIPSAGNNSVQELTFDVMGVASMDIALVGSGAMTGLEFMAIAPKEASVASTESPIG